MNDSIAMVCAEVGAIGRIPKEDVSKLKRLRIAAGMSRAQLSEASGVNARQIQRIENGESEIENVTFGNVLKLADALGVEPRDLI